MRISKRYEENLRDQPNKVNREKSPLQEIQQVVNEVNSHFR
jgi:hypothetical protein